ncbi:unnamed protein product [Rotaria socialis]
MSTNDAGPSFSTLPVELLYQIFDYLDAPTIFLSVRSTCRRLKAIVNTYDRFNLNLSSISKPDFHIICSSIHPSNIILLTLSDDSHTPGQIELFLSLFCIRQFNQLRSLTLCAIKEDHLNNFLQHINTISLIALSFNVTKYSHRKTKRTAALISSVLMQLSLRKLHLGIEYNRIRTVNWPVQCTVQYLRMVKSIEFNEFCSILHQLSHLRTLVLGNVISIELSSLTPCRQIISLTFEDYSMEMYQLALILSLTPSLIHLKLIGNNNSFQGNQCEQLIQENLPLLNKFEFFLWQQNLTSRNRDIIEEIIEQFRTPFWLEYKRWFITCEYSVENSSEIRLYSIPVCCSYFNYEPEAIKVSCSNLPLIVSDGISTMDNVKNVFVNTRKATTAASKLQIEQLKYHLFLKTTQLALTVEKHWPLNTVQLLSSLIDLSQLVYLKIDSSEIRFNSDMMTGIASLLKQTCNISSLEIQFSFSQQNSAITAESIYSIIPTHVKHLRVTIYNTHQLNTILELLKFNNHLSSVHFHVIQRQMFDKIIPWLVQNTNSMYRENRNSLEVWLSKSIIQLNQITFSQK